MLQHHFPSGAKALCFATTLLLAACASTPVEPPPAAQAPAASTMPSAAAAATPRAVAPVTVAPSQRDAAGPTGIASVVYFEYDSAAIRPEFQELLQGHARYLTRNKDKAVRIAGHTDERGGREYNLALGQQRAEAVRRALQLLGASTAQVEAVSFGEEKPVGQGHDEQAWSRDRRAEIAYR